MIPTAAIGDSTQSTSNRVLGFSSPVTIPEVVFDQSNGGQYLFTQYDGTYGSFTSALSIATGTLTSMSKTSLQSVTNVSNLKDQTGAAITAGDVTCAWWLSETRFLFVGRKLSGNTYYVWLCNYNGSAWTVGANAPAFDNTNAVLALGLYSGTATAVTLTGVAAGTIVPIELNQGRVMSTNTTATLIIALL